MIKGYIARIRQVFDGSNDGSYGRLLFNFSKNYFETVEQTHLSWTVRQLDHQAKSKVGIIPRQAGFGRLNGSGSLFKSNNGILCCCQRVEVGDIVIGCAKSHGGIHQAARLFHIGLAIKGEISRCWQGVDGGNGISYGRLLVNFRLDGIQTGSQVRLGSTVGDNGHQGPGIINVLLGFADFGRFNRGGGRFKGGNGLFSGDQLGEVGNFVIGGPKILGGIYQGSRRFHVALVFKGEIARSRQGVNGCNGGSYGPI